MKRPLLIFLIGLAIALVVIPSAVLGPYYLRVQHFGAQEEKGYHADFFLYVSPEAKRIAKTGREAVILVQPNNSGTNSDDPEVHRKDAWWMGFGRHFLANDLGVILLVPAFVRPSEDWRIYTHALDRDVLTTNRTDLARLDLQLIAMIEHARSALATEGIHTKESVLMQGYSASGMFANRFTVLHPQKVLAVSAGSPGGWPIAPVASFDGEELPYPAGISDLEALTGEPFDSTSYRSIPQLIVMGDQDENDSLDFTDGWDEEASAQVDRLFGSDPISRWDKAESLYRTVAPDATFLLVENIGHNRKALQHHTTQFFKAVLSSIQ